MTVEEEIRQHVEEILEDTPELFLVEVKLKGNQGNQRLIVIVDGDNGVTIDQCSKISRTLSGVLEERDLISGKYHLEVSSAGIDFPLQSLRQYKKNVGRKLKVTLQSGDKLEGELKEVNNDLVVLEEIKKKDEIRHEIDLKEIEKSIVLVSFK